MKQIQKSLSRLPLTVKMVFLTLIVGILIWAILDFLVNRTITNMFEAQLSERLNSESTSYRYRLGRYVYAYNNLAMLVVSQRGLIEHVDNEKWSEGDAVKIEYYRFSPKWFPGVSMLRAIAIPRYAILLDTLGRAREVYHSKKQPPPQMLLKPPISLLRRSEGISYLTNVESLPYLITTEKILGSRGESIATLMLASPLDTDFLLESQGRHTENLIIALVTGAENRVIVTSNPKLLPSGVTLESVYGQHISVKQAFFEYGDSEMNFKFASLVPKDELLSLTGTLVSSVRKFRAVIALVFIISFALISYYTTRRIESVTRRITEFSSQITGEKNKDEPRGDQLHELESRFNRLREEVIESREIIRQQAEEKTLQIVNQAHEAIITINKEGLITSWNPMAEQMFEWSKEEVLGKESVDIIFNSKYQALINNAIDQLFETGCESMFNRQEEILAVKRGESSFPAEFSISSAKSDEECFIIVMVRDISERQQAVENLLLSEEKFSKAFRASPVLMIISTIEKGRFIDVNETFLKRCGYIRKEVIGVSSLELGIWADKAQREIMITQLKEQGGVYNSETKIRVKNRDLINVLISAELIEIKGEKCILAVLQDLTERKQLEEQLLHSQKMEAVGHLAGGVAHDFNNILTAIIGFGNIILMQKQIKEDGFLRSNMDKLLTSAEKAAALVRSLLTFSRKQAVHLRPVDLNQIIARLESLLARLISENIDLRIELMDGRLTVMADSGQIEQVIMNLATNARDAMSDRGKLFIETGEIEVDHTFIARHGYGEQGQYAFVRVNDTGTGMDDKTKQKIFEPFFTTKDMDKGTGLGLSIIFGIIKQHKGYIDVDSSPGHGTTIQILLPKIQKEKSIGAFTADVIPEGGSETLLLAEDNDMIRDLIKEILENYGYTVISAHDGNDAVNKFLNNREKIEFLLLDVMMPGRNGKEVYDEVRKVNPEVKGLFMSGYSGNVLSQKGIDSKEINIIYKPVAPHDLLVKIREVLGGNSADTKIEFYRGENN